MGRVHVWVTYPKIPQKSKIAHIAVYSDWMVMGRGCNPPLGVFGGVWGCLGAQTRVFEFKITFLNPVRALENCQMYPKIGQNRPK